MRLEDLDRCGPVAFEEYLGMEDMALTKANVSSEQPYAAAYRTLMNQAIIPLSYADRMYSSRYARHFYSDKERECFRAKWCHAR